MFDAATGQLINEFGGGNQVSPNAVLAGDLPNTVYVTDTNTRTISLYNYINGERLLVRNLDIAPTSMTRMSTGELLIYTRQQTLAIAYNFTFGTVRAVYLAPTGLSFDGVVEANGKVVGISENGARVVTWPLAGGFADSISAPLNAANVYASAPVRVGNWIYSALRTGGNIEPSIIRRWQADTLEWDPSFMGSTPGWRYLFHYVPAANGYSYGSLYDPAFSTWIGSFDSTGLLQGRFGGPADYKHVEVLPAGEATVYPNEIIWLAGLNTTGSTANLTVSDDWYATADPFSGTTRSDPNVAVEFRGLTDQTTASSISLKVELSATTPLLTGRIQVFNYATGQFVTVSTFNLTTADATHDLVLPGAAYNYLSAGPLKARVFFFFQSGTPRSWQARIDRIAWTVLP